MSTPKPVASRQAPQGGQENSGAALRLLESTPKPVASRQAPQGDEKNSGAAPHLLETQAAQTWVLLRGLTRDTRHWGAFPREFREAMDPVKVIALDLPGNGHLYRSESPASVEAMAAYCRAELAHKGLAPPYHLLAMSLGAMVAAAWATEYPQEIAAAVLINTSLRPFSPFYHRLRPRSYAPLLKLALLGGSAPDWEETIFWLTTRQASADVLAEWIDFRQQCPVSRANALRQLTAAMNYRAPLGPPIQHLLILASLHDGLVDVRCSKRLAQHWHASIVQHPTAGHDLPLDDGPWVVEQVCEWMDRWSPRAPQVLRLT